MIPSDDKAKHLEALIHAHQLTLPGSIGVGDTISDAPFLKMVETAIAFNPDQKLLSEAKEHGWNIVVERKNVIYELEKKGAHYQLS